VILAAADSYHALTEARPHRPPRPAADAAANRAARSWSTAGYPDGTVISVYQRSEAAR